MTKNLDKYFGYVGVAHVIPGHSPFQPGGVAIENAARSHRPTPPADGPCGLCGAGLAHYLRGGPMIPAKGKESVGDLVALCANERPIVKGHLLAFPFGDLGCAWPEHRELLSSSDVQTIGAMVRSGVGDFAPFDALVYMNMRGAGQSIRHVHWHVIHKDAVPRLDFAPGAVVCDCGDRGCLRLAAAPFPALVVAGGSSESRANLVVALDRLFADRGIAYNLVAQAAGHRVDMILIPRGQEKSPSVDQNVGALELITGGIFIPGPNVSAASVSIEIRDRAISEVALPPAGFQGLIRDVRARFDSRSAPVVVACLPSAATSA